MDETSAAVSMDFVIRHVQTIWSTAALTRAEHQFGSEFPGDWSLILENVEDFGMAVEIRYRGTEPGPNGGITNYELVGFVDDSVIEHDKVNIDRDVAQKFADLWAEKTIEVVSEAQESTTLSPKEFATYITMMNESVGEGRAADALGISVGTYRGKRGRIQAKQEKCKNTSTFERLMTQPAYSPKFYDRTIGEHGNRPAAILPTEIYEHQRDPSVYEHIMHIDAPLKLPRESPEDREHETYNQGHWRTGHIEDVDNVFVADTSETDDRDDVIRIDFDGRGHGGADMHQENENVQVSAWFGEISARRLYKQLGEHLDK